MAKDKVSAEPRQTTFRIPTDLLKRVRDEAFDRRVSAQAIVIDALTKYFTGVKK